MDLFKNSGIEFVALLSGEYLHGDYATSRPGIHPFGSIFNISSFLAEERPEQALFGSKLALALRRNLADENVARTHLGANADDTIFGQVLELRLTYVRNIAGGHLRTKLGITNIDSELSDVDGCKLAFLHQALGNNDGVFIIGSGPAHECNKNILPDGHLTAIGRRGIGENHPLLNLLSQLDRRTLMKGGEAIGHGEIDESKLMFFVLDILDGNTSGINRRNNAIYRREKHSACVANGNLLDSCSHKRRFR